jgi:hypothetical protein
MTTIVIIIIAIVALVVVVFFFFSGFAGGEDQTHIFFNISSNKTADACSQAAEFGGCPSDKPHCCNGVCQFAVC